MTKFATILVAIALCAVVFCDPVPPLLPEKLTSAVSIKYSVMKENGHLWLDYSKDLAAAKSDHSIPVVGRVEVYCEFKNGDHRCFQYSKKTFHNPKCSELQHIPTLPSRDILRKDGTAFAGVTDVNHIKCNTWKFADPSVSTKNQVTIYTEVGTDRLVAIKDKKAMITVKSWSETCDASCQAEMVPRKECKM